MSTDLLKRAAAELDAVTSLAAAGPWTCSPVYSPDSHATSAVYSNAYRTGTAESEVVGSTHKKKGHGGIKNPHNAIYIAMMQPSVAGATARLLEQHADEHSTYDCDRPDCAAIELARVILGEAS